MTALEAAQKLLLEKEAAYLDEQRAVQLMLLECGHLKVQPGKGYWEHLRQLERQVNAARAAVELIAAL